MAYVVANQAHGQKRIVTGNPGSDGQMPRGMVSVMGGAAPKPQTWGDRVLRRRVRVLRLEPVTQTRRLNDMDSHSPIDGELYTPTCRRGNIRARVVRGGTTRYPVGSVRKLHPFTGNPRPLPVRFYEGKRRPQGKAEPVSTLFVARPSEEVAA